MDVNEKHQVWVPHSLIETIKKLMPETKGQSYTGVVDVALRKLITILENGRVPRKGEHP